MVVEHKKLHSKKSKRVPSTKEGKVARSSKAHKQSESRSKALSSVYSSDFVLSSRCSKGKEKAFCSFREILCLFLKGFSRLISGERGNIRQKPDGVCLKCWLFYLWSGSFL